jgi:hypothetical protein
MATWPIKKYKPEMLVMPDIGFHSVYGTNRKELTVQSEYYDH